MCFTYLYVQEKNQTNFQGTEKNIYIAGKLYSDIYICLFV